MALQTARLSSSPDALRQDEPRHGSDSPERRRTLVIGTGRPAATVAFESEVVDFFVSAANLLSVPKSFAAIYGIVFASPIALSFSDIEMRLALSKGSISQGLRALREVGAVIEVSKPRDPAELFTPDLEMRRLVGGYLSSRVDPQIKSGRDRLNALESHLPALANTDRKLLGARLKKLQSWHSKTRALLPLIRAFLKVR